MASVPRVCRNVAVCCAVGVLVLSGCGGTSDRPDVVPVSGKVLLNGEPVAGAQVTFHSEGSPRSAGGTTNQNGEFQLTTFDTNDGAVPGEHKVTILKPNEEAAGAGGGEMDPSDPGEAYGQAMEQAKTQTPQEITQLPQEYADPETTPLTRTVAPEPPNEFTFELSDEG